MGNLVRILIKKPGRENEISEANRRICEMNAVRKSLQNIPDLSRTYPCPEDFHFLQGNAVDNDHGAQIPNKFEEIEMSHQFFKNT